MLSSNRFLFIYLFLRKTKLGAKASEVHLIGHSLGAHAAGYAGEKILNLGQITGCTLQQEHI
jgi:hypothetical protein